MELTVERSGCKHKAQKQRFQPLLRYQTIFPCKFQWGLAQLFQLLLRYQTILLCKFQWGLAQRAGPKPAQPPSCRRFRKQRNRTRTPNTTPTSCCQSGTTKR